MKFALFFLVTASVVISGCDKGSPVTPPSSSSPIYAILNGDSTAFGYWSPSTSASHMPNMIVYGNGSAIQQNIHPWDSNGYAYVAKIYRKLGWQVSSDGNSVTFTTKSSFSRGSKWNGGNDWIVRMKDISGGWKDGAFSATVTYESGKSEQVTFILMGERLD